MYQSAILSGNTATGLVLCSALPLSAMISLSALKNYSLSVFILLDQYLASHIFFVSAHPFLSLAFDPVQEQMAIGTADGKVDFSTRAYNSC